jgi:translocation and assembly module TamB
MPPSPPSRRLRVTRPVRVALAVVAALALVATLAAVAAVWLVSSGDGARFALDRLDPLIPGELALGRVEGRLRGPLHIEDLVYSREGFRLTIGDLRLSWDLRDLLRRQLDIHALAVSEVRVEMSPGEESREPFALPQVELPVNVVVREATLRDAVVTVGEAEPIVVRSAALTTSTRGDTVTIDSFDLDSPDVALEVSGSLTPLGAYAVDLEAAWLFHAPDGRTYRGEGSFDGTLEDLVVDQRLIEPFAARVEARLLDPLDDLRFEGGAEASGVVLSDLDAAWPAAEIVAAELRVQGSLDDLSVQGSVVASSAAYGRVAAELDLRGGGESWRIEDLRLEPDPDRSDAVIHAKGDLRLGVVPHFALEARWNGLRWPLAPATAETFVLAPSGAAAVEGTVDDYRLELSARLGLPGLAAPAPANAAGRGPLWIDAELAAAGDRRQVTIERFEGLTLGGRVTGKGTVSWQPAVAWRLALAGAGLRPALLDPRLDGALELAASTSGVVEPAGPRGVVVLRSVEGTMRGSPVRGAGRIDLLGDAYRVPALELAWGDTRLEAAGSIGEAIDLRFSLRAPDLSRLLPELAGSLEAQGKVTGARQSPALLAEIEGARIVMGELAADALAATARVGQGEDDPLEIVLDATAPRYGTYRFASAHLRAAGTRASHTLEGRLVGGVPPLESFELAARGGLRGSEWRGEARRLVVAPAAAQRWTLAAPAAVVAGPELVRLGKLCLRSDRSTLCAAADWRGAEHWSLDASARQVALDPLVRLWRDDPVQGAEGVGGLAIDGVIDGTVKAAGTPGGSVRGTAVLTSSRGTFELPLGGENGAPPIPNLQEPGGRREWRDARVELVVAGSGTRAEGRVDLIDIGTAAGWIELPGWSTIAMPPDDQALRGSLQAAASSLEPLGLLSDAFARPRGRLEADLEFSGTLGAPRVAGAATLRDGSAFVVPLGIDVTEVELTATPDQAGRLALAGSLESGGVLTVRGSAPLDARGTLVQIEASGDDVLVMDLPDRHVVASTGELALKWGADGLTAAGEVLIPEARLQLGEDSPDAVSASSDVVFVRVPEGEDREPAADLPLHARVRLIMGDEVAVTGLGLEAEVRGSVLVVEEPGSVTRATGELDLSGGTFQAYGQKLELERGRLIFAQSPIGSPALDLRASRSVGEVVAGIDARGTLDHPRVELWSDPTMPQAEQLSYLLLGRSLNDASAQDGDVLASAARSLGLRGGRYLAGRLGSTFGLEEARIDTEDGFDQASLVLGKFLSPRLYVSYGVALFDGTNAILIRYLLSEKLTLEATTGENNSADVLYVIETGPGEARPDLQPGIPRTRDQRTRRPNGSGGGR